jgi:hypothetical protein
MDFIPLLLWASLIKKVIDFVKYLTAGDVNAVLTQVVAWAVGVGLAFVTANSEFGEAIIVNGHPMNTLNSWALVLAGLNAASVAGLGWDTLKALDNTNSAKVPDLVNPSNGPSAPSET